MDDTDDKPPVEYMSYNGLGRSPMVWGVPFMAGLAILCGTMLPAMLLGIFVSPIGWGFAVVAVPLVIFTKVMCATDDKAIVILLKEVKWAIIKQMSGNANIFGGTFTMSPVSYSRKIRNVECAIKAAVRR